jgi:hypothetical protein
MTKELAPHNVGVEEYKGNKILKIYKVDDEGNELEKYGTIVSFGLTKAQYILENIEGIKKFVETYSKES